jgi:iron(III) transport system permease protein
MADFGNPVVVGGQFSVLSTEIFFAIVGAQYDQGRAASLAWLLTLFALACSRCSAGCWASRTTPPSAARATPACRWRCPTACAGHQRIALPWIAFTLVVYLFAFAGGFVQTWGRDYTLTLNHFRTAFALEWGQFGLVWAGTAWNSLLHHLKLAAISAPLTAGAGPADRLAAGAHEFRGQGLFEFARCWPSRFPARCSA